MKDAPRTEMQGDNMFPQKCVILNVLDAIVSLTNRLTPSAYIISSHS